MKHETIQACVFLLIQYSWVQLRIETSKLSIKLLVEGVPFVNVSTTESIVTISSTFCNSFLFNSWTNGVILDYVFTMVSLVAYYIGKKLTTCGHMVEYLSLSRADWLCFLSVPLVLKPAFSTANEVLFSKKQNSFMAAPSSTPFISEANFNFFRKSMIDIFSKGLKACGFILAVMRLAILAIYLETDLL